MDGSLQFSVFGARGYVGSHLTSYLRTLSDVSVFTDSDSLPDGSLGHVFYCIGVTTDFKRRLTDTMRAHVCKVLEILCNRSFSSFTYLSSSRVYERGNSGEEDSAIVSNPANIEDFYKISKLAGEAACLTDPRKTIRVVRLSNVLGMESPAITFVPSIICNAIGSGKIVLQTALDSAKDYITMEDVVQMLPRIALMGNERIYNLASGRQIDHLSIVNRICSTLGCNFEVQEGAPKSEFPEVNVTRLANEFGFKAESVLNALETLCLKYQSVIKQK